LARNSREIIQQTLKRCPWVVEEELGLRGVCMKEIVEVQGEGEIIKNIKEKQR
jgi:hypothetical protein